MKIKKYHRIYVIDNCNEKISDNKFLTNTLQKISTQVGMHVFENPVNPNEHPESPSYSALGVTDVSRVTVQAFGAPNKISVDIFSFKEWSREEIKKLILKTFSTKNSTLTIKEIWWG
ncbi:MAG: hypothetical protein UU64_C0004G0017 [candidate division WWE3 bacterium GW2011_GWF2_41_45]|uniref:Uncharacterized protein n=3 Tax=Katanobacteria TaxID=422282 RepID=A0A1F4W0E5_UNCKA|nr:MAG: hypothetical protein UU55_C0007G0004 [candidate division WWE3 bacterium GW2011_GWC2_41_23]KKS10420.1 MAG: hypothetical protein UU64_C0004G0017 [candidate division WWE3 bacterium GW2011_GWF2_41_45]KKS12048.1 MAG: hypothetical protein UU68_C0006G0017 [candidate division WWE3 bacterium GW2011_GWF1_41_53]KKS20070.1 MAG: hypothetical protein UU79_C0004G0017 [candidate division WWE3 bacterium GW2011_GWE1_41_72]KKS29451.1 MAG: hypothetical protein UU90_C0009G0004 [candidate division WWE3 bacte